MSKKDTLIKQVRKNERSYLNRDFDSLRSQLVQYGRTYFSDKINDFGPEGVAGMFVEMAAYVGDVMSYYMDHQFGELDIITAVETQNIERLIRSAGVKIKGASPATVSVSFYFEVPAKKLDSTTYAPNEIYCPIVEAGTTVSSAGGVKFELLDNLNFSKYDDFSPMKSDTSGNPTSFAVKKTGLCSSGITMLEKFSIPDTFAPFRTVTLSGANISEIISIVDSDGNEYYEVEALTQDVVYKRVVNTALDSIHASESIELIPAPYRFISTSSRTTGKTTVRFGGGSADSTDNDLMPDPSELSLPMYGKKKTISRFTIDPNKMLQTRTLGISPRNTSLSVRYRAGGGLSHNVAAKSIRNVNSLQTKFSSAVPAASIASTRTSLRVSNTLAASGGENAQTLNEIKATALAFRNSQSRIVTKQDLVARIYAMPSKFGRVFRAGVRSNSSNPLSSTISIISRDIKGYLMISPDTLKENLKLFLNDYRLITDAYDIVDTQVINLKIAYSVVIDSKANSEITLQAINKKIKAYMRLENFQIDQPLLQSDLVNIIINSSGVLSLVTFEVVNIAGVVDDRVYSDSTFSVTANTDRGIILPPDGSIFEVKYPDDDITGIAR